jgi:hypothetical protein
LVCVKCCSVKDVLMTTTYRRDTSSLVAKRGGLIGMKRHIFRCSFLRLVGFVSTWRGTGVRYQWMIFELIDNRTRNPCMLAGVVSSVNYLSRQHCSYTYVLRELASSGVTSTPSAFRPCWFVGELAGRSTIFERSGYAFQIRSSPFSRHE